MEQNNLTENKHSFLNYALSMLLIAAGGIFICLPLFFWDFLLAEQFKPTVRPFYPLFYGAILAAGIVIALLGFAGFFKKFSGESKRGNLLNNFLLPVFGIITACGVLYAAISLYTTTQYWAADKLFLIILAAPTLAAVLFMLLVPSGILVMARSIKKKGIPRVLRRANICVLIFALMAATVGGVILLPPDAEAKPFPEDLPFKIQLYAQGDAGYDTFKIPTMITAANGTILCFAEARSEHKDDWSKTDVVVRKSYDFGSTWTPLEVIIEENDLVIGNACPVVEKSTGFIWLIFCKQNFTVFKTHSEDNGESWTTPVEITNDVKLPGWTWYATGPSHGIQLSDGTLVIPADHVENRKMKAHVIYSKDSGASWQLGGTIPGGEEATLAELDSGDLYINIRPVKPGFRVTALSGDKGLTWNNIAFDKTLPDPACQGNLIKVEKPGGSLYVFSNSADSLHREKMTVRLSNDECKTWSASKVLYEGMTSYSALSLIDAQSGTVACVFEHGANYYAEKIVFVRFTLDYINNA